MLTLFSPRTRQSRPGCFLLLQPERSIEAQRRVALFQQPRAFERAVALFQPLLAPMLGDDRRVRGEQPGGRASQQAQRGRVLRSRVIGRIEKKYFVLFLFISGRGGAAQKNSYGNGVDAESRSQPQPFQVAAQDAERRRSAFDKLHARGPAADGLQAHRARTGIKIQKGRALNAGRQHVEEGFTQPVAGGPGGQPRRGLQSSGTEYSGNDSHWKPEYRKPGRGWTLYNY